MMLSNRLTPQVDMMTNCNAVLTAIRRVQEYIFNDKLSKEDVDHMNYHHCIGGTIQ